jgi:alkylation response protein AidB-like acyl-CoA dehydrogenase
MPYRAPLKDMLFVMNELADLSGLQGLAEFEDAAPDLVQEILEQQAKFCHEVIAPLNRTGDQQPSVCIDGKVTTTPGFKQAFSAFGTAGWQGVAHPPEFGGQGLPKLVATPCIEMLNAANLSFALCPMLTDSAIEALLTAGSQEQRARYLHHLISGKWTGTMNLTEPQAGSDLALIRTRAVRQADGDYRIFGTKIYITYGDHDMAENIIHFVLARTPDAPQGIKGISLFIVPKLTINSDGSLGANNDVECISLEHKLGIKASPTAVLQFGNRGGAVGALVGEENRGLEYMFIMMNAARFGVGMQGIGLAERAYQKAVDYAKQRVQSRDLLGSIAAIPIIEHPDVRRMLMSMRAQIEAARALAYVTAAAADVAHHATNKEQRELSHGFYEYLVPVIKGWATEIAIDVASTGIQVHGGMGFIEETGAAQYYRDARILTIYEGTTAIQANDLISRKTSRDEGALAHSIIAMIRATQSELDHYVDRIRATENIEQLQAINSQLGIATQAFEEVVNFIVATIKTDVKKVFAGSVPYLRLAGIVLGGWQMARAALVAHKKLQEDAADIEFFHAKIATARFYADHILSQAAGLQHAIVFGGPSVLALPVDQY